VKLARDAICKKTSSKSDFARVCKRNRSRLSREGSFDRLWTYLYHEDVGPTSNLAERDIRPSVIQRKLSYGTQTDAGEAFVERILSVGATCRKQAKNIFDYLTACFTAYSRDAPIPNLF